MRSSDAIALGAPRRAHRPAHAVAADELAAADLGGGDVDVVGGLLGRIDAYEAQSRWQHLDDALGGPLRLFGGPPRRPRELLVPRSERELVPRRSGSSATLAPGAAPRSLRELVPRAERELRDPVRASGSASSDASSASAPRRSARRRPVGDGGLLGLGCAVRLGLLLVGRLAFAPASRADQTTFARRLGGLLAVGGRLVRRRLSEPSPPPWTARILSIRSALRRRLKPSTPTGRRSRGGRRADLPPARSARGRPW